MAAETGDETVEAPYGLTYRQRPKPYSAELELMLAPEALRAQRGRSNQNFPLHAIERITLRFTPKNTVFKAFSCHLRATDGRSLQFENFSWKSLVETERQDADYTRFVRALVEVAAIRSPGVRLVAGLPPFRYWLMLLLALAMIAAMFGVAGYFFMKSSPRLGMIALAANAYLGYWLKEFARRNRPRDFTRHMIPADILPG